MGVKIKINGQEHEADDGQLIINAAEAAGVVIPRYCYHPGLSIAASCRMCLVELEGQDRLVPSCQVQVREGMNVLTASPRVRANQSSVMEYLLLNHPLDCPVCDQAGECYLQDYSYQHGHALSRFLEPKIKQPKKDVGEHVLLYTDRCILCSRCVRFTREVSGTAELTIADRGSRSEIEIFPGAALDNKLSGNVVDLCPVGALLDKSFLHTQRVWFLKKQPSVCPGCSHGCNIFLDHNKGQVWRVKPRTNLDVNDYWICDEGRQNWRYIHDENRLDRPARLRRGDTYENLSDADAAEVVRYRLQQAARKHGPGTVAAVLSPMWTTEEQFLAAALARTVDPQAILAMGPVPVVGQDDTYKSGFTIYAEKAPNKQGAQRVLAAMGGTQMGFDELIAAVGEGKVKGLLLGGGYPPALPWPGEPPKDDKKKADAEEEEEKAPAEPVEIPPRDHWLTADQVKALATDDLVLIIADLFATPADASADLTLSAASWAEKNGTFVNVAGRVQRIGAAPLVFDHARPEGEILTMALDGADAELDLAEVWARMADAGVEGFPPAVEAIFEEPANPYAASDIYPSGDPTAEGLARDQRLGSPPSSMIPGDFQHTPDEIEQEADKE